MLGIQISSYVRYSNLKLEDGITTWYSFISHFISLWSLHDKHLGEVRVFPSKNGILWPRTCFVAEMGSCLAGFHIHTYVGIGKCQ